MTVSCMWFPDRFTSGWPEPKDPDSATRAGMVPLGSMLTHRFETDAHLAGYAADVDRRLKIVLFQSPAHADLVNRVNLRMVAAIFDVDDPVTHKLGQPARDEWLSEEREKLPKLLDAHPGAFLYQTRGGYRIVYALREPHPIRCQADDDTWKARYLGWTRYLARAFDIRADENCADWTRLFRLPFVVRQGHGAQTPRTFGNPNALGVWAPKGARPVGAKRAASIYGGVLPVPIEDPSNEYGQARIASAVQYLERAQLSIQGERGRDKFFVAACYVMRRLRMPLDLAIDLFDEVYNPRLAAVGTEIWSREELEDRLASAARTSSKVEPGSILTEAEWREVQAIMRSA